ncbi:hypothetical protein [Mesorhizobium sp. M0058]|uniref:hypothetical protein n=1 Tax=Mesorhizobium sp. M0058 TaxID=2956865 RepID=UPI0033388E75
MTNGDDMTRQFADPSQGAMSERVTNMGRRINDVEVEMRSGFSQINQSIAALSNNLAERNKTQWPVIFLAIGVASSVLGYFVTQALTPIRDASLDMKAAIVETQKSIQALAASTVSRQEMDWRAARGAEDRARSEAALIDLRATTVGRNEWGEKNLSRDHDIANLRETQAASNLNVQRQIDQIRGDLTSFASSLGNGRDTFADMKAEIRRLEERLDAWRMIRP